MGDVQSLHVYSVFSTSLHPATDATGRTCLEACCIVTGVTRLTSLQMDLAQAILAGPQSKGITIASAHLRSWLGSHSGGLCSVLWGTTAYALSLAGGSGSGYITGFCDKYWRPGMSAEQAEDFVRRAIGHALARDGSSGGCIRTVTISKAGVKRTFTPNDEVSALCGAALWGFLFLHVSHCVAPNVPRARLAELRSSGLSCLASREHYEIALNGQDSVYAN